MDVTWLLWDCSVLWLAGSLLSKFQHGKGPKSHLERVRVGELRWVEAQGWGTFPTSEVPHTSEPPAPTQETPPDQEEMRRRVTEAEQLEEVGRLPVLSPTWQLAQMAADAGPSTSGGEEPAHKKLQPTMGGKAPQMEFLWAAPLKKSWKYQLGTVALHEIHQF